MSDAAWHPDRAEIDRLLQLKRTMIAYLETKVGDGDFHAVQDAASDIREINAKLEVLGKRGG